MSSNWKLPTKFDGDQGVTHDEKEWSARRAIGSGASGTVWLQELTLGGPTSFRAVKTINKWASITPSTRTFLTEVEILSKVAHRNDLFVEFLGWYEDKAFIYIAMEFIKDGDLSQYIQNHRLEVKRHSKEITKQLLTGLEVLHSLGICHRDLKPKNILIASCNPLHVKISDFGIAKIEMNTVLRTNIGTHGYFAPEIMPMTRREIKGFTPSRQYTKAVDMWALGILLYEMLTSVNPFLFRDRGNNSGHTMYSGVVGGNTLGGEELDFRLLIGFCAGTEDLPLDLLEPDTSVDVLNLLKSLIQADPKKRISAASALESEWILSSRPSATRNVSGPDPTPPMSMDPECLPSQAAEAKDYDYLNYLWGNLEIIVLVLGIIWTLVLGIITWALVLSSRAVWILFWCMWILFLGLWGNICLDS